MKKTLPTLLNLALGGPLTLEAAASEGSESLLKFSGDAYTGVAMQLRGFWLPVVVDLQGLSVPNPNLPFLYNHDQSQIVGHGNVTVSQRGIKAKGTISGVGPAADEVKKTAANGFPWQLSIGARPIKVEEIGEGVRVKVNGRSLIGPLIVARASELREVSFVSVGADPNTSGNIAASFGDCEMTFENWLKAMGLDIATLGDETKAKLQAKFDAEMSPPVAKPVINPADEIEKQIRASAAKETNRIADIKARCAKFGPIQMTIDEGTPTARLVSVEAHAIEAGWTPDQAELVSLRLSRPTAPIPGATGPTADQRLAALQGAMILRAGARLDNPVFQTPLAVAVGLPAWLRAGLNAEQRQRAMESAHRYSDMSMVDLARASLSIEGKTIPDSRFDMIRAAFSGSALTNIFTTNVNAVLLATYAEAGDTTMAWTKTVDVADFKTNDRMRLTKGASLAPLPRGGTADHVTRSDTVESYKIRRYAGQFVVDEQDMIDDAFNAFADMPVEMGNAAARLRPDLVYGIILNNDTLTATGLPIFSDSNAVDNNLSGALAAATLRTGVATMMKVTENGVNLNLAATHLLVPPSLKHLAYELTNSSQILITGSSAAERGSSNALLADGLVPVCDARLENGVVDPDSGQTETGSASAWYLVCNKAHTIEVAYLRGTGRAPQARSFVLTQGQWGMGWDVNLDIGAKALDWKGLQKNS